MTYRADWLATDRRLAGRVAEHLVHLIAEVSPGAKLGSTAPYSYAECVLIEAGCRQPRSLANAFLKPVRVKPDGDLRSQTFQALAGHLAAFDGMYDKREERRYAALSEIGGLSADRVGGVDPLAQWAGRIAAGEAS